MTRLILASTSPYRRRLLESTGLEFEADKPDYDETAQVGRFAGMRDEDYAVDLARGKAESLAARYPDAAILGADQIAVLPGPPRTLLHKPGTREAALEQLLALRGRTHRLVTGVALVPPDRGPVLTDVDVHELTMRAAEREELQRYVDRFAPLDSVGAYRIEDGGHLLFSRIAGEDFTGIVGLPMLAVARLLRRVGLLPGP